MNASVLAQSPQVETTPIPQPGKPDFSSMSFLVGTWNCSVMSSRRPGPYTVTATTTMSPNGYWMLTRSTIHKASWIPTEFVTEDRVTNDGSTSRWVDINTDELGGYDLSTSPGWTGNNLVWTDVAYPKTDATATNNPTTETKVSDTQWTSQQSFTEPSGRVVTVKTNCTKS
jgi:hypothetical protein